MPNTFVTVIKKLETQLEVAPATCLCRSVLVRMCCTDRHMKLQVFWRNEGALQYGYNVAYRHRFDFCHPTIDCIIICSRRTRITKCQSPETGGAREVFTLCLTPENWRREGYSRRVLICTYRRHLRQVVAVRGQKEAGS